MAPNKNINNFVWWGRCCAGDWKAAAELARKYESEKMTSEWNTIWSSQSKREGKTSTKTEQSLKSDLRILEEFHESLFFSSAHFLQHFFPTCCSFASSSSSSSIRSTPHKFFFGCVFFFLSFFLPPRRIYNIKHLREMLKEILYKKKKNISRFHFFLLCCVSIFKPSSFTFWSSDVRCFFAGPMAAIRSVFFYSSHHHHRPTLWTFYLS